MGDEVGRAAADPHVDNSNQVSYKAMLLYYNWLQEKIAKNVPMDEMVQELLGANGGTSRTRRRTTTRLETDPLKVAENIAQVFMGMRIQCAQCHNHPFDRWTMDDYYGFAAFFTQIGRKNGEDPRETIVFNRGGGEANHPVGERVVPPKFLGGEAPDAQGKDRRAGAGQLARLAGEPVLRREPRQHRLGPLLRPRHRRAGGRRPHQQPASNPELLEALGKKFVEYKYDFKQLVRDICTSRTYQLATRPNETNALDDRNFAHGDHPPHPGRDVARLHHAGDRDEEQVPRPAAGRARRADRRRQDDQLLPDHLRPRHPRDASAPARKWSRPSPGAPPAQRRHRRAEDHRRRRGARSCSKPKKTPREIVQELYLRCFGRKPTAEENSLKLEPHWGVTEEQPAVFDDVFWALLNAKEFMFNH